MVNFVTDSTNMEESTLVKIPNLAHFDHYIMKEIRNHFPILSSATYLDTAANGLIPDLVFDWRRQHDLDLMEQAATFRANHQVRIEQIRKTVSGFFNATLDDIALIPNFSFGINMVLEGLPKGQKVLLLKNDYPSVNWPVETRDFNVCYAEIDEKLEENIEAAIAKHRPEIFIFSLVQWLNGIKIDFEFLKRLKSYNPQLLIIADGTQYLGTEKFSFATSPIDVLAASSYKWLTAGYGNGFIVIRKSAREKISPKTIGFNSASSFESEAADTTFMKHFEPGHQDTLNYGSLEQSILFVESLGEEKLYENIKTLSANAKMRFSEMGLLKNDTLLRQDHSSIFNLKLDKSVFQKLKENNIIASLRGGGIRVSFHYYNSEDDLERLIEVLG